MGLISGGIHAGLGHRDEAAGEDAGGFGASDGSRVCTVSVWCSCSDRKRLDGLGAHDNVWSTSGNRATSS